LQRCVQRCGQDYKFALAQYARHPLCNIFGGSDKIISDATRAARAATGA
jgi:hypothetical protein